MTKISFKQVDVFTSTPFRGNPVAVILNAANLSTEQMQQIANWTNLSETTFVLPPTDPNADYQVRIFTPHAEMPFAGHPTIGTAHALLEAGLIKIKNGQIKQQCTAGLVPLTATDDAKGGHWLSFDSPAPKTLNINIPCEDIESSLRAKLANQATPQIIDVGPKWIVAQLPDANAVLAVQPDISYLKDYSTKLAVVGITIFGEYPQGSPTAMEVRSFAPAYGINEDPVCGSGNACVGAFVRNTGQIKRFGNSFFASQGVKLGRSGVLRLNLSETTIQVGGQAVTCIDGNILSPA